MKKRIITVSRQFGSGGHSIAQAVAERLGIPFYDNQLITEVAKQSGLSEDFIRENEEYASHSSSFLFVSTPAEKPVRLPPDPTTR